MSILRRPFQTWKVLALIIKHTAIPAINSGVQADMTQAELDWSHATIATYPGRVVTYSQGYISINLTTIATETVQTTATAYGGSGSWYVSRDDAASILTPYNVSTTYDGVFVFASGSGVPCVASGLTNGSVLGQCGYSHITATHDSLDSAYFVNVLTHEWNHQQNFYFENLGYTIPQMDQQTSYTDWRTGLAYTGSPDDGRPWLSDVMTGRVTVPATGAQIGTTLAMWRSGRPIT